MNKTELEFLEKEIEKIPYGGSVAEIGSWTGGSAYTMQKAARKIGNPIKFFFIDPWRYGPGECAPVLTVMAKGRDIRGEFDKRLFGFKGKYTPIQKESVPASAGFSLNSLDMVFIDGDHSYEGVKADIEAWLPKVKPGGVICGHDYNRDEYGVTRAVDELFGKENVKNRHRSMWKVIKRG